jgi:nucleotide-binding universal stress UspA family protein
MASRSSGDEVATRIVVGIGDGGPSDYRAALALAAQMSRQHQAELTLVHGCLPRLSIAPSDEALKNHLARGEELLQEAERALSPLTDHGTPIHVAAVPLTGVDALVHESQTAEAVIVQRRDLSAVRRAFSGDTSHTAAAQAACPVIVVRDEHQIDGESTRAIVVGVGPDSGLRALHAGVAEAQARKCPLIAIFVWDLQFSPTYGGRIDPDQEELAEAASWADSRLAHAVAEVLRAHPDVEFHARTVKGEIEDGLLQESEEAALLVVERHRDAHRALTGLGTLTRHLIDHAPCPVMVTPHSDAHDHAEGAETKEHDTATPS